MKQDNMLAMILAGGRGTRLHDLTKKVAKPAVSYGGKYRIIDFPLSNCANSGIDIVGDPHSVESVLSTAMLLQEEDGDSMQRIVEFTYFLLVRKQIQDLMYTEELPMRSPRISTLSILILRSILPDSFRRSYLQNEL